VRKLALRSETLADLTPADLATVAGGSRVVTNACVTQTCTGLMCLYTDVVCLEG
jgi:hypothetical protein